MVTEYELAIWSAAGDRKLHLGFSQRRTKAVAWSLPCSMLPGVIAGFAPDLKDDDQAIWDRSLMAWRIGGYVMGYTGKTKLDIASDARRALAARYQEH
jgi:hypothetical protein